MKLKGVIAILLCFVLLFCQTASASGYFGDKEHLQIESVEYVRPTNESEYNEMAEKLQQLCSNASNKTEVLDIIDQMSAINEQWWIQNVLACVESYRDVTNVSAAEEVNYMDLLMERAEETMRQSVIAVLNSPCAEAARQKWGDDVCDYYLSMPQITEEQLGLYEEINALINEYQVAATQIYKTETSVAGRQRDASELAVLYQNNAITLEEYYSLYNEIEKQFNSVTAEIYLKIIALENQIANLTGYDNYIDYAYKYEFMRDYTPDQIEEYLKLIKQEIAPLYAKLNRLYASDDWYEFYSSNYTLSESVSLLEEYLPQVAEELGESLNYMLDNGLYDFNTGENRTRAIMTMSLPRNSAFMFATPSGNPDDLNTLVHEMGHYNAFYWAEDLVSTGASYDVMEIHSQALELIFMEYYDDIYGEFGGEAELYRLSSILQNIVYAAFIAELEIYAFTEESLTVDQLNSYAMDLLNEYQLQGGTGEYYYNWVYIPHMFENPGYYISYSVSAMAAMEIWDRFTEDRQAGIDTYMTAVAGLGETFFNLIEDCQLFSPFTEMAVNEVRDAVEESVGIMTDTYGCPSEESIDLLTCAGLVNGYYTEEGYLFKPEDYISRAEFVKLLYEMGADYTKPSGLTKSFADVNDGDWYKDYVDWAVSCGIAGGTSENTFSPNQALSRQDMAVMLLNFNIALGLDVTEYDTENTIYYRDADEIVEYAVRAIELLSEAGILTGDNSGDFRPKDNCLRGEAAEALAWFYK